MTIVYLALGSNVGDSTSHIETAKELLAEKLTAVRSVKIYNSQAVGYTDQPDFKNTIICGQTDLSPTELLNFTQAIEAKIGRTKTFRWGPREIDIDIIFYDDLLLDSTEVSIPHPRFAERDFVLRPLCDLCPDFVDPKSGTKVSEILKNLPATNSTIK